jgi:hypothetical protein
MTTFKITAVSYSSDERSLANVQVTQRLAYNRTRLGLRCRLVFDEA